MVVVAVVLVVVNIGNWVLKGGKRDPEPGRPETETVDRDVELKRCLVGQYVYLTKYLCGHYGW